MELYEVVELTVNLPDEGLTAGAVGTIVHIYEQPNHAYEVEFSDDNGKTLAMLALQPDQIRHRAID
jgi:hypothetical protein